MDFTKYTIEIIFGLFIAMLFIILLVERSERQQLRPAKRELLLAKAEFYRARAKNLDYQNACSPQSDALYEVADALQETDALRGTRLDTSVSTRRSAR